MMGTLSGKDADRSPFPRHTMVEVHDRIRPGGPSRGNQYNCRTTSDFDNLIFLPASLSQVSNDLDQESGCARVQLGKRYASRPLDLSIPFLLAPMGFGTRSRQMRQGLARAAARLDTAYNTGEGGLVPGESEFGAKIVLQIGPSRLGIIPRDLQKLAAIEIVLNTANHGVCRNLPSQIFAGSSCGNDLPMNLDFVIPMPVIDFHNVNTLRYKVLELREATNYEIPIFLKAGGDMAEVIRLAAACEVDVVTIDGLPACFPGVPAVLREHLGLPTLAALAQAVRMRQDLELEEEMDLVVTGGIRDGADAAKCLALGARAVTLETGCSTASGCQAGADSETASDFAWETAVAKIVADFTSLTQEVRLITQACGKYDVNNLEPEDLRALSIQTAAVTGVALAGSNRRYRGLGN